MELVAQEESVLQMIGKAIELIMAGRSHEIDMAPIQRFAPDVASKLAELIQIMNVIPKHLPAGLVDMPIINQHLLHISQTTEAGVLTVLNTAEAIMNEASKIKELLDDIERHCPDDDPRRQELQSALEMLNAIQDNSFSILTSLEFEDANRQLMGKIIQRLEEQNAHLLEVLPLIKNVQPLDKNDSVFLKGLKHIIDLEHTSRQSQDMIDDFFEDFGD